MAEVRQSLARGRSPLEDLLQITLDNHRTRLHRDVLDAADVLGFHRGPIIGRQFLMGGQCRNVSRSV